MAGATMRARMSLPAPAAEGTIHSMVGPAFGKSAAAVVLLPAWPPQPVRARATEAASAVVVSAVSFFISQAPLVRWG